MLPVTKINGAMILVNPEIIQHIEATPDTIITFVNGKTMIIKETIEEIKDKFVHYQRLAHMPFQEKSEFEE